MLSSIDIKSCLRWLTVVIISGVMVYGFFGEPYCLDVHLVDLKNDNTVMPLKNMVIVHLTDLHIRRMGRLETKVLEVINRINPDLILLTGDYVPWRGDYQPAFSFLAKLKAAYGVYGVLGDYDRSCSRKSCQFCHGKGDYHQCSPEHNVIFLRNKVVEASIPGRRIRIAGIDGNGEKTDDVMADIQKSCPDIVLSHSPFVFDDVSGECESFVLAGDTHGGQIGLPAWCWHLLGYEKNEKYNHGLFYKRRNKMFVSRGVGTSHVPFRFFSKPEVVVYYF